MHKIAIFGQSGASKDKKKASDWLETAAICNSTHASTNVARGAQVDIRVKTRVRTAPERRSPRLPLEVGQSWARGRKIDFWRVWELFYTDPKGERSELDGF